VAIVQARLGSTRFPRKALADLNGHPLIWHVVSRAAQIPGVNQIVLAVPASDKAELGAAVCGLNCFVYGHVGPGQDVMARFAAVARLSRADAICRVTGDCVVLDPQIAGQVLKLFHASQPCHFASNDTLISGYVDGTDFAVMGRAALETAAAQATDPADREHIECWFKRPENGMRCVTLYNPVPWTGPAKLSVDTPEDLETVKAWLAITKPCECGKECGR
jgi:spore coat polysaccharide biosynthesis protein SpsF (cytidylyltransferase family)